MKKLHLSAVALAVLSLNVQAACETCITQRQLIESTPAQLVSSLESLGKRTDLDINASAIGWNSASNPDWANAYSVEKVQAVTESMKRNYSGAQSLTSITPHLAYLAAGNYLHGTRYVTGVEQMPEWFSTTMTVMLSQSSQLVSSLLTERAGLLSSVQYGPGNVNDATAVREALRLSTTMFEYNVSDMHQASFTYYKAASVKPFARSGDGKVRSDHLNNLTYLIGNNVDTASGRAKLLAIPAFGTTLADIGAAMYKYDSSDRAGKPFYSALSVPVFTSAQLRAINAAIANVDVPSSDWSNYLSVISNMSEYHLHLAAMFKRGTIDCKRFTVLDVCPQSIAPKIANMPSITRNHITVFSNLPDHYKLHLTDQMLTVHAAYMSAFNNPEPVAGDTNSTMKLKLYRSYTDYVANQILVNNLESDNGGLYVERDGTLYTFMHYEDGFNEDGVLHTEELVRHEYAHWLNGRYLIPGGFNQAPLYTNDLITSIDEGLANVFAGASNTTINPLGSMVSYYKQGGYTPNISRDMNVKYGDQGMYEMSTVAMSYALNTGRLSDLANVMRSSDVTGIKNWKNSFNNAEYTNYVNGLAVSPRPWPMPFIGKGLKTNQSYTNGSIADVTTDIIAAGGKNVQCTATVANRFTCTMDRNTLDTAVLYKDGDFTNTACTDSVCYGQYRQSGTFNPLQYTISYSGPTSVVSGSAYTGTYTIKMEDDKPLIYRPGVASSTIADTKYNPDGVTFTSQVVTKTGTAVNKFEVLYGSTVDSIQEFTVQVTPSLNPTIVQTGSLTVANGAAYNVQFTAGPEYTVRVSCASNCPAGITFNDGINGTASGTWAGSTSLASTIKVEVVYAGNVIKVQDFSMTFNAPAVTGGSSSAGSSGGSIGFFSLMVLMLLGVARRK